MSEHWKNIVGILILIGGFFTSISFVIKSNTNFALIAMAIALIIWMSFTIIFDTFDVKIFSWIISITGFLISISILFLYGIEQVPYPIGAIVFHAEGFASSLAISIVSFFPILFIRQFSKSSRSQSQTPIKSKKQTENSELFSDEWDIATEDEFKSGDFETN